MRFNSGVSGSFTARRGLTLLAGLLATIPVIVSTVRALSEHWTPFGDRAVIAVRALDVFTLHSPLVGQYSAWSTILTRPIFSPGPLLYWLLAVPARWLGTSAMPIWIGVMNGVCVLGIVALARRRGGQILMFAAALALLLTLRSLPAENLHDPWDPSSPLLPVTLLFFLAWSLACGEYRLLPVSVLVASFAVQTHLAFLVPSVGMLVIAAVGLIAARGRLPVRLTERLRLPAATAVPAGAVRPWALGALGVAAVCWALPIIQQIARPPGNMFLIAKAVLTRGGTLGNTAGWHALVRTVGVPPWWLRLPVSFFHRLLELAATPGVGTVLTSVLLLLSALGVLWLGLRRGRGDIASGAAIALVLPISVGLGTASTPTAGLLALTIGYTLWWASPAGMFSWLVLGWGAAGLLSGRRGRIGSRLPSLPGASGAIVGLLAVGALAVAVAAGQSPDSDSGNYRPFRTVMTQLDAALPHPHTVLVTQDQTGGGFELGAAIVYELRRQGARVMVPAGDATVLGRWYRETHRRYDAHVLVGFGTVPAGRIIARVRVAKPASSIGTYTVALAPGGEG